MNLPDWSEVERRWSAVVDGSASSDEVSRWAEPYCGGFDMEELLTQALLHLQSLRFVKVLGGDFFDREAAALARWRTELPAYDSDPDTWNRKHLRRTIAAHAKGRGLEAGRAFGVKLVAAGNLTTADVDAALDE
jgi:hypothetical protein